MEISLESATAQNETRVTPDEVRAQPVPDWNSICTRIQDYLRAWGSGSFGLSPDLLPRILESVQAKLSADSTLDAMKLAIDESDLLLKEHWAREGKERTNGHTNWASNDLRSALVLRNFIQTDDNNLSEGEELRRYLAPRRPMETFPQRMRTSLTRIPSFRLVGGWCLVIVLLVLTFIFTHGNR